MKGISAVIAIVMILMITIALSAMAYIWFTEVFSGMAEEADESTQDVVKTTSSKFIIESAKGSYIYVRNTGETNLTNFSVYVDGRETYFENDFNDNLGSGESGKIILSPYSSYEDVSEVVITTSQGITKTKKENINECDDDNVILCLTFDDESNEIIDYSNYGNNGTIYGDIFYTDGISGKGIHLDGDDDYVTFGNIEEFNNIEEFTLEAWAKADMWKDAGTIINKGPERDDNHIWWCWDKYNTHERFMLEMGGPTSWTSYVSPDRIWYTDKWYHFVSTFSNSQKKVKIFIDGVKVREYDITDGYDRNSGAFNLKIGVFYTNNAPYDHHFNGTLDEIRVYNNALAEDEILNHYNSGIY